MTAYTYLNNKLALQLALKMQEGITGKAEIDAS